MCKQEIRKWHVKLTLAVMFALVCLLASISTLCAADPVELAWPSIERSETRPWTWWWWHGCAVTKADITANLESLQKSGIGGVSIVCLLDVRNDQARKLSYLSKEWVEAIVHAKHEARRLGMDVDMSPVPGWAFGGPWVTREDSCAVVEVKQWKEKQAPTLSPDDIRNLDALMLVTADGQTLDLTDRIREAGGVGGVTSAPAGTYYAVITRRGSSNVRMPTADGSGWVVDHLSPSAVRNYFRHFDQAFAGLTSADLPRAFNNDSWEITLDWTPGLLDEFAKRRGYDLRQQLPAFAGQGSADLVSRVACDYRETVADLMLDHFTATYKQWAAGHGCRISGEVIDEPGNDLDLNMLYDIPQADMGGPPSWFFPNGDYATGEMFRRGKSVVSPAHILGKPLIASETLTCLGPILDTPLEQAKEKIDYDLVAGINHTMFHGISYSPASARWPGWLFYAGTHLGPFNPMWRQGKAFCDYVARCQSFLQTGRPDSDVLLYYPVHDSWSRREPGEVSAPGVFGMASPGPVAGEKLWRAGYDFDFCSDRLLESFKVIDSQLVSPGTTHRALVVSGCRLMPAETLERIIQLADGGATVIFDGELPADVPGLGRLDQRRAIFKSALSKIESARAATGAAGVGRIGKGKVIFTDNVLDAMVKSGIQREAMVDSRLHYVRRSDAQGTTYFITSLGSNKRVDEWIPVAATGESAAIFDPMTGAMGIAEFRKSAAGGSLVRLQLEPRESRIVRVLNAVPSGPAWPYLSPAGDPIPLTGSWNVRFLEGGETIPHAETIDKLTSWTEWKSDQAGALRAFSGVASYTLKFPTPRVSAHAWAIDLGNVCHTARVRLNGTLLGDLFCRPMRVTVAALAKDGQNILEIEVANAPINRAADLDIRGIIWQKTIGEDASSYKIGDFLFNWSTKDAKWVPRPSGLLGPVRLIPLAKPPSTAVDATDLRREFSVNKKVVDAATYGSGLGFFELYPNGKRVSYQVMNPAISDKPDNRPAVKYRLEAKDHGVVYKHGNGPDQCDYLGARDLWIYEDKGTFYMHYDGAGPKGWLACLATSTDLVNWTPKGPVLDLGASGAEDSASASYGTTYFDGKTWHMFYLGTPNTSPGPDFIPAPPYLTMKAEGKSAAGPWVKQPNIVPFRPGDVAATNYGASSVVVASPGMIVKNKDEYMMFFSGGGFALDGGMPYGHISIARTKDLNGKWTVDPQPMLPWSETCENSSLYYEPSNKTWFLFTNHIDCDHTDAIWVYWTKDLNKWNAEHKAVVLDGRNCKWSKACIGLPSVLKVGNRLAVLYDAPGGDSIIDRNGMNRDIGLAWLELPLRTPEEK